VERILACRTDARERRRPAGGRGQWLSPQIFQRHDGSLCFTDEKITTDLDVSHMAPREWRRRGHPALNPEVNGGKLRFDEVPKLVWNRRGPAIIPVSFQEDIERIAEWRERQRAAPSARPPAGWEDVASLTGRVGMSKADGKVALAGIMPLFREECPAGVTAITKWDDRRNRGVQTYYYDPTAFTRWLAGRDLAALGAEATRLRRAAARGPVDTPCVESRPPAAPDPAADGAPSDPVASPATRPPSSPFLPSPYQRRILALLDRRALKTDTLQAKMKTDRKSLYKRGLNELMANGLVQNNRRVGYFRPDAPPPELAQFLSGKGQS
jgi:hypothetical protein